MRRILVTMLNGDQMPELLMHIIRFVMPSKNKQLKKLLHFYWEICQKLQPDGKLKQEMILVCNAIRNDLQHPNEYIRGATLRFLCKLKEPDLLEPLIPSVRGCLEHRHAYVRKNAVFAVYSIVLHSENLIPDATDLIELFLENETDATCTRNAFVAISNLDRDKAFAFLQHKYTQIANMDELLQLAFIEFIRRDSVHHSELKQSYLKIITDVLDATTSNSVVYEAATALTSLTSNPAAVHTAASKFIDLAIKESDNNVKLIVLDRVDQLRFKNPGVLNDLSMDILLVLSSPDLDVRKKALDIALNLISSKNVDEVVKLLKKELAKTVNQDYDKNSEYRQLLIQAIHSCAIKFSEVAASVVDLLLDFIGDFNSSSAVDVISFVKEVVEYFPDLRPAILKKLLETLKGVRSGSVYRGALWIIGEYCLDKHDIQEAWVHIRNSLGEIPILSSELKQSSSSDGSELSQAQEVNGKNGSAHKGAPKVLADGTYASESAFSVQSDSNSAAENGKLDKPPLRALILNGSWFTATVLASTLTKLVLRYSKITDNEPRKNALRAEALLIMTSILRVGESEIVTQKIDEDSFDRIFACIKSLTDNKEPEQIEEAFLEDPHEAFKIIVRAKQRERIEKDDIEKQKRASHVDDSVSFRQFTKIDVSADVADEVEQDLSKATGSESTGEEKNPNKLKRIVQLTGFSDPVYAEAFVNVHQFDIVLDVLLFNPTDETLQNLSVEFATLGDLKVVEKPSTQNVGPHKFHSVQTTIKVSSADAGVIFGSIVYEGRSANDTNIVILNDVQVDIMDYIKPGDCTETAFRLMWSEFEWENKVNISVKGTSLNKFLRFLIQQTNTTCLTPSALTQSDEDQCQFLSANLHARSSFGEDALANVSIEKDSKGQITGHVRIRAKAQGLALSLGDKVAELTRRLTQ